MDTLVDGALAWSAMQPDDLDEVCALRAAIDWFDDPVEPTPSHLLHERLRQGSGDPTREAVVGRDRGHTIVAYAWNVLRPGVPGGPGAQVWLDGGVHPAERHHGIGRHLLDWQLARVEEWAGEPDGRAADSIWVGARVDERVVTRSSLMRAGGLEPERWFVDLRCVLDATTPRQVPGSIDTPHGRVRIVTFDLHQHGEAVRVLHNEIFGRLGAHEVDAPAWDASLRRADARRTCSWVALARGEVIGYALNSVAQDADDAPGEGWTDRIGVAHSWRGQGIGSALLSASRACFADAGLESAGVGVDTRDRENSLGAFQRAGYAVSETVALWSRQLRREADGALRWEAPGRLG